MKPQFFFVFSNPGGGLNISEEYREVYEKIIDRLAKEGKIEADVSPYGSFQDLFDKLLQKNAKCSVFHYAGHSNSKKIRTEIHSTSAKTLADLLKAHQTTIKLAFLNACSNQAQVDGLFDAGVPAVIATSKEIFDDEAIDFAKTFYSALAMESSIGQAFNIATNFWNDKYSNQAEKEQAWKLNIRPGDEEKINWSIKNDDESPIKRIIKEGNKEITILLIRRRIILIKHSIRANSVELEMALEDNLSELNKYGIKINPTDTLTDLQQLLKIYEN